VRGPGGRGRAGVAWQRLLWVLVPLAIVVFAAQALIPLAAIPQVDMNASRVLPSVALARGYGLYAGPTDGAVIDFMYGPVGALAFLPAALAATPSAALLIAAVLNVALFFAPMVWLHLRATPWAIGLAGLLCFGLLAALDGGLSYSAFTIHVDAPALALGAAAAGVLLVRRPGGDGRRVILSAACTALAVWTKQTTAPIAVALPLFLLATDGFATAARHCLWTLAVGLGLAILFVGWFGLQPMVFNMVTLLTHQPWYGEAEGHGRLPAALNSLRLLAIANRVPALLVVLVAVLAARARDRRADWRDEAPWLLLLTIGVLEVPMCVLGGAKVGGYLNTHSYTTYFVLGAATLGLTRLAARRPDGPATLALAALLVVLVGRFVAAPVDLRLVRQAWTRAASWSDNPQQQAYDFARAHPGEAYFPWNPLSTLLASGVLFHSEIGMWDRELAGFEPTPAHLRQHLPADVRLVASRPPTGNLTWLPPANHHMAGFTRRTSVPGLEGWDVFTRE